MPRVSEAAHRHAEGLFSNSADAGMCTSLNADEYGTCLVKPDDSEIVYPYYYISFTLLHYYITHYIS